MIRLLRWLITGDGHKHTWEIYAVKKVEMMNKTVAELYILQCKHCGDIKQKEVSH